MNQIDDLLEEIQTRIERGERTLVTTLTKRMAEELNEYFLKLRIKTAYIYTATSTPSTVSRFSTDCVREPTTYLSV